MKTTINELFTWYHGSSDWNDTSSSPNDICTSMSIKFNDKRCRTTIGNDWAHAQDVNDAKDVIKTLWENKDEEIIIKHSLLESNQSIHIIEFKLGPRSYQMDAINEPFSLVN